MPSFPCLSICRSWLTRKMPLLSFGSGPNWAHFGRFGGNNSNKKCQIKLKFGPWITVQMLCKIFWKTQFYRDRCREKVCIFGGSLTPIYALKMTEIQKSKYSQEKKLPIGQCKSVKIKARPYLISIFNEKCNYFLWYLSVFQVRMGAGLKIKKSEVRLASRALDWGLTGHEKILVPTHFKLTLFQL